MLYCSHQNKKEMEQFEMKKWIALLITSLGVFFFATGCGIAEMSNKVSEAFSPKPVLTPEVAKMFNEKATVYTRINMHYYIARGDNIVDTTNYQLGMLIPVNSQVVMQDISRGKLTFLYKGQVIVLKNTKKYSGLDMSGVVSRYFSKKKVDLSKFTAVERRAIREGTVVKGMRKNAVLVSLGYPPKHRTPDLKMDRWTYWKNRWSTFVVFFKNDKVMGTRGL